MLKLSLQRIASLWLLCLLGGFAKAQDMTATWSFKDSAVVANIIAASNTTDAITVRAIEDNGILLTVEANGNAITKKKNSIVTEDGVAFKVPVQSNKDTVYVTGVDTTFAYSIAGTDAKTAFTKYQAKDADVTNGFVEIVNHGGGLLSIMVLQKEKPKPLDPPALDSLIINGTKYAASQLFGKVYEGKLELNFTERMISVDNPIKVIAKTGMVDGITYTGDDTKCTVVIKMSNGEQDINYTLNITQKPSAKLTYYDSDGITVLGEARREIGKTIDQFDISFDAVTVNEGYKMRGWYHEPDGGLKYTVGETVNADMKLYAITTIIEEASMSAVYNFDLTNIFFDPANHEAFNPKGEGFQWSDDVHGWSFKNDNQIDLLVGPRATISLKLCQENKNDTILIKSETGDTLTILHAKTEEDGEYVNYTYNGEAGTISLIMKTASEIKIHGLRILNTAESNYTNVGNWYIVSPGDSKSLLDVIDIANILNTTKNSERLYVFLPKGTYDLGETVETTISGYNISIIGQSADSTIVVTTPDYLEEGLGTSDLLKNTSTNLYLQDLTLKNALEYYESGSVGAGAVFNDLGNHTVGKNVRMLSYENTYYSMNNRSQSYWEDCDIHGTVDFICGGGDIRFYNSTLSMEPRYTNGSGTRMIVAPRTLTKFGYVFDHCKVVDLAEGKGSWSFGRSWSNQPIAVYLSTTLDEHAENTLISTRWTEEGKTKTDPEVFGEYNTMDINGIDITPETNTIKIKSSYQTILSASMASTFDYDKMFSANAEKKWDPAKLTIQVAAPVDARYDGNSITWSAVKGAIAYAVYKNGEFEAIVEDTSYNLEVNPDAYRLSIRSANAMGGFGPEGHVAGTIGIKAISNDRGDDVIYNLQGVQVKKPGKGIYIINGKKTVVR